MATFQEIEDKYDVDRDTVLPALDRLPGVERLDPPEEERLEATYFDTPDLALARAGVTLRRRTGGHDAGWHLKLPGDEGKHEVRVPLSRASRTAPKALRDMVYGHVRGRALTVVATIRTTRTVHRLRGEGGAMLAEVADDQVEAESHGTELEPARDLAWREWEVELVDGDGRLLERAAKLLREAGARDGSYPSKLVRTLGDRLPPKPEEPAPPSKKSAASEVVGVRLATQIAELHRLDPLVRCDLPDAVHRMRVTCRRLRSALATFRPLLRRDVTDPIRDEVRWLTGVLGEARDLEVLRERILEGIEDLEPEQVRDRPREYVGKELGSARRDAHGRALAALGSERYLALLDSLDALRTSPPWGPRATEPATEVLPGLVKAEWKRLRKRVKAVGSTDEDYDDRLHDVRKAARRTRYAAECLAPSWGDDANPLVKELKGVQSLLGDHQDGVVTRARLLELAAAAAAAGRDTFTYGVLHAKSEADTTLVERHFGQAWHAASRSKLRRWLG
jgi:CHAD domain-containing protein